MFRAVLVVLSVGVFALVGCNMRGDVSIDRAARTVTVTLTESEVNEAITAAIAAQSNPLMRDPSVDLQPGLIVVSGQHLRRNGSGETVSGSFSLSPSVVENRLSIAVSAVSIEGIAVDDSQVQELANRVADRINAALQRTVSVFEVNSINVTDSALEFVLKRAE